MQGLTEFFTRLLTIPSIAEFVNSNDWVWPVSEMIHYAGMSMIIGVVGLLDLRILGFARKIPPAAINRLVPVAIVAFVANLLTGLIFMIGNPAGGPGGIRPTCLPAEDGCAAAGG
jgi:hypothetical protein